MGFAWNLILFSFMREREGYKHHADCTVSVSLSLSLKADSILMFVFGEARDRTCDPWFTLPASRRCILCLNAFENIQIHIGFFFHSRLVYFIKVKFLVKFFC